MNSWEDERKKIQVVPKYVLTFSLSTTHWNFHFTWDRLDSNNGRSFEQRKLIIKLYRKHDNNIKVQRSTNGTHYLSFSDLTVIVNEHCIYCHWKWEYIFWDTVYFYWVGLLILSNPCNLSCTHTLFSLSCILPLLFLPLPLSLSHRATLSLKHSFLSLALSCKVNNKGYICVGLIWVVYNILGSWPRSCLWNS